MSRKIDRYHYNPAENARINGVDEDSMRYYIRTKGIDRRYEAKVSIVEDIRKHLTGHPDATKVEVVRATGHGINITHCPHCPEYMRSPVWNCHTGHQTVPDT